MKTISIVMRKVSDLYAYEKNAKCHPEEQIRHIAASLEEFGWKQPLVIATDGCIVVGHGRFEAAKLNGYTEVPCIVADDLTPEQIKAFRLVDNKTNESPWNFEILDEELADLSDLFDMSEFGFIDPQSIDWAGVADLSDETYEAPEKDMLECPHCHHIDSKNHFKKVAGDAPPEEDSGDGE